MKLLIVLLLLSTSAFALTIEPYAGLYGGSKSVDHDNNDEEDSISGPALGVKFIHGGSVGFGADLRYSAFNTDGSDINQTKINAMLSFALGSKVRAWALYAVFSNNDWSSDSTDGELTMDSSWGGGIGININRVRLNIEYEIGHFEKLETDSGDANLDTSIKTLLFSVGFPM